MAVSILLGIFLAAARIWIGLNIEPEPASWAGAYQAVAHLFVGGLAVAWYYQPRWINWQWTLFWTLNIVEVATAILSRMGR